MKNERISLPGVKILCFDTAAMSWRHLFINLKWKYPIFCQVKHGALAHDSGDGWFTGGKYERREL